MASRRVEGMVADQLALELPHAPSHAEDDFILGDGNRLAFGRIAAFPDWSEPTTLLIGPPASGKSHLARIFAQRNGARFVAPHELETAAKVGGTEPLIIENADFADLGEDALFHLLNQSRRDHRPLLITARRPLETWDLKTDDVRSRLRRATVFELALTDDIQLSQMFVKVLGDRQIRVDPRVIGYLVARMERSGEEVVALAELMDRLALARGSAITRRIAAQALEARRQARGGSSDPQSMESHDHE